MYAKYPLLNSRPFPAGLIITPSIIIFVPNSARDTKIKQEIIRRCKTGLTLMECSGKKKEKYKKLIAAAKEAKYAIFAQRIRISGELLILKKRMEIVQTDIEIVNMRKTRFAVLRRLFKKISRPIRRLIKAVVINIKETIFISFSYYLIFKDNLKINNFNGFNPRN